VSADDPMDEAVNLLVSCAPRAPGRSRREIVARLRGLGDPAPLVSSTERKGIMTVRTSLDPRDVVRRLRALHHDAPAAIRYTTRWLPVDAWTAPDTESLRRVVTGLRERIGPGERWRMSIERRAPGGPPPAELIAALAPLIEGKVDLTHPDKVLRLEVFSERAAVSIVTPDEIFSARGAAGAPSEHEARA
jgi:tRNA(Ser,Leu) C12 N-acetylase TAN1